MIYCKVIDNQITEGPRTLPPEISTDTAAENNWVPTVFLNMPHHIESECNKVTQIVRMQCTVIGNQVECRHVIENKSPADIQATTELLSTLMRQERNKRLLLTDWTQLPVNTLSPQQKAEWEVYRNRLRNLPQVTTDLNDIQWPTPPFDINR